MIEDPRPEHLSPLGSMAVFSPEGGSPVTAHLWLSAGVSGQDGATASRGRLVTGLKRLTHIEEFLNQDNPIKQAEELGMKRRGLTERRGQCFVAEPCSLAAQEEALELILDYLLQRYPDR